MTGSEFKTLIHKRTGTNDTTFPEADLVAAANSLKDDIAEQIVTDVDEDYFAIRFKRDLKDSENDVKKREYSFPNNNLKHILRAEAKLANSGENWVTLKEYDEIDFDDPLTTEENVIDAMQGKDPGYNIFGTGLRLLTDEHVPSVTEGLYLWALLYPQDLTVADLSGNTDLSVPNNNQSFGLPRQLHRVWMLEVSKDYKLSRKRPIPLDEAEKNLESLRTQKMAALRNRNINTSDVATTPYNDGTQY